MCFKKLPHDQQKNKCLENIVVKACPWQEIWNKTICSITYMWTNFFFFPAEINKFVLIDAISSQSSSVGNFLTCFPCYFFWFLTWAIISFFWDSSFHPSVCNIQTISAGVFCYYPYYHLFCLIQFWYPSIPSILLFIISLSLQSSLQSSYDLGLFFSILNFPGKKLQTIYHSQSHKTFLLL